MTTTEAMGGEPLSYDLTPEAADALAAAAAGRLAMPRMDPPIIDTSEITPAMVLALHKAQQQASAIPKRGWNNHARYHYSTAEDVIAGARDAMDETGLSILLMWGHPQPSRPELGELKLGNQQSGSYLPIEAVVLHSDGQNVGQIRIRTGVDVMIDARRPPDKAVQAARTYAHGFVLCSLLNIDRGDREDDVDQRPDAPASEPQRREEPRQSGQVHRGVDPLEAARGAARAAFKRYVEACRNKDAEPLEFVDFVWRVLPEAEAKTFDPKTAPIETWQALRIEFAESERIIAGTSRDTEESVGDHPDEPEIRYDRDGD